MSSNSKMLYCGGENLTCPKTYFCTANGTCVPCSNICTSYGEAKPSTICNTVCPGFLQRTYGEGPVFISPTPTTPTSNPISIFANNNNTTVFSGGELQQTVQHVQTIHYAPVMIGFMGITCFLAVFAISLILVSLFLLIQKRKKPHNDIKQNVDKDVETGHKESTGLLESQTEFGQKLDDVFTPDIEDINTKIPNSNNVSDLPSDVILTNECGVEWRNLKRSEKVTMKKQAAVPTDSVESTATASSVLVHEQVVSEPPEDNQRLNAIPIRPGTDSDPTYSENVHDVHNTIPNQTGQTGHPPEGRPYTMPTLPVDPYLLTNSLNQDDAYMPVQCCSCGGSHEPDRFVNNASVLNPSAGARNTNPIVSTESSAIEHEQVFRDPPVDSHKLNAIPIRPGTKSGPTYSENVHNEQKAILAQISQTFQPQDRPYTMPALPVDPYMLTNSLREDDANMPVQRSSGASHEPDRFVNKASVRHNCTCAGTTNRIVRNREPCENEVVEDNDNIHFNGSNDHIQQCTSKRGISDECNPDSQPTHALNSLRKVDVADMNTHSCNNVLHEGPTGNTQQCACKCGISDERQPDSSPNCPMNSLPKVDVDDMKHHSHNNIIQSGADSNNPICNCGVVDEQRADSYPTKALNSLPTVDINEMETHGTNNIADTGSSHDSVTPYPLPDEGSVPSEIAPTPNNTSRSNTPQPHSNNS